MRFLFNKRDKLPALAWLAIVRKGNSEVEVLHGKSVECKDGWFAAGVWDGDFAKGDTIDVAFACCSSGLLSDSCGGGVKFATPSHTLECLSVIVEEECLYVSNSLPFLLAYTGCVLDVNKNDYEVCFCRSIFGLDYPNTKIDLASGRCFKQYRYCVLSVDKDTLEVKEEERSSGLHFSSYENYIQQVNAVLGRLVANANDDNRKHKYGLVSTISRGYDATGVSVLAKEVGCDVVMTFNGPGSYVEDCGSEIARTLGYKQIYEFDAHTYKSNNELYEAESCATGDVGGNVMFAPFKEVFSGNLLFMGTRGDSIWAKGHKNVNDRFDFTLGNGLSQTSTSYIESCLKNNTIMVMPILIGADHWQEINEISLSDEMNPWSIGGRYDRPIPRRMVEEKGVERVEFGQEKRGAGISYHFDTMASMRHKMSVTSYSSFESFCKTLQRNRFNDCLNTARYYKREFPTYFNYMARKLRLPFRLKAHEAGYISSPLSIRLILWGMDEMTKRYQLALQ